MNPGSNPGIESSWRIAAAGYHASVLEAGGGLATLSYDGVDLVAGPTPGEVVGGARGQLLVPWPNRIRDGRYAFAGEQRQLAISEPAFGNASHGLVRWLAWHRVHHEASVVELGCRLVAQPGYPWELDLGVRYAVDAAGLSVTISATNRTGSPAPFAAGMHPYFDLGLPADQVRLTLPAGVHQLTDERHLPTGTEPVSGGLDFRGARVIGALRLDDAFTDLVRDASGLAVVRLEGAHAVELHLGPQWRWAQVFTGDTLSSGARASVAVEPMTAPADAFNSGVDLITLAPGVTWSGDFRISAA